MSAWAPSTARRARSRSQPSPMTDGRAPVVPVSRDPALPCPEPAGGWRPVEPAKATNSSTFEAASRRAQTESGFGRLRIDQQNLDGKRNANDPRRFVLNVTTTGEVVAMEHRLREIWGGTMCVSQAARSEARLSSSRRRSPTPCLAL
jgi:hypothetical protein